MIASYLEREHFEVTMCHNGTDAVAMAREVDPDVVVLDLGLPGIDGVEVCRQLRTFSDAYVVMLTARDTEVDTIVGLSVGADDYVTKPFSPVNSSPGSAPCCDGPAAHRFRPPSPTPSSSRPGRSARCPSTPAADRFSSTATQSA